MGDFVIQLKFKGVTESQAKTVSQALAAKCAEMAAQVEGATVEVLGQNYASSIG